MAGTSATVTVDTITGDGTLGLNFDFDLLDSVTDDAGNAAAADFTCVKAGPSQSAIEPLGPFCPETPHVRGPLGSQVVA